ncbi:MAG TPA: hypothetical protein VGR87_12110 [Candidatus Limnocylindria bacterium]|jgi:hypothetical protein|nr:hypothetical protein [Candidatus Limnocylindria bacterium]
MRYTGAERAAQAIVVGIALVFAMGAAGFVLSGGGAGGPLASAGPTATATPRAPEVKITQETCCAQTARGLLARWESSARVSEAKVSLVPDPGFACGATVEGSGLKGTFSCAGLLRGATDYVAKLQLTTAGGSFPFEHKFKTMGDRLNDVKWFTEFEDPTGEPLACAAASCRIIQNYTTGKDPYSAQQILDLGRQFNRSRDPGLDPVAIATVLQRMDPENNYHYYRYDTREDATGAAVYWLIRSGKPVMVISLAGQHGPVLIGFQGTYGTFYDDPANRITGVIVQDPQRGDIERGLNRRPDKYRTPEFQTGRLLAMEEWNRDEWWLGFPYAGTIRMPDGSLLNIERNDGVYPTPHWGGKYVIIVDDGDVDNPPDREGRVKFR